MEIRRLRRGEEKAAYKLSDSIFRTEEQKSMGEAFPSIFLPDLISNSYGGFVEEELVVFIGLVPETIRVGNARFNVYSIGSVCTHPDHREKGYAADVLNHILSDLKQTEASLLLVSGHRSLYTRVGCQVFGGVNYYKIDSVINKLNSQYSVREVSWTDLHALGRLASRRTVAYDQLVQDLGMLIEAEAYASCLNRTHKVKVLEEEGEIKAFLVAGLLNKESELRNGLGIEWAGESHYIEQLVNTFIHSENLTYFDMPVPWHDKSLNAQFEHYYVENKRNQGTIYMISPKRFIDQAKPFYKESHHIEELALDNSGSEIKLQLEGEERLLSTSEFISLFFDPDNKLGKTHSLTLPFPYTAGLNYI